MNKGRRNFLLLFAGQTVSQLGSSMTGYAAILWAYQATGKATAAALLAVCTTVPSLLVGLFGGAAADRFSPKRIMLICDLIAALGTLCLLLCASTGTLSLWVLCAVNAVSGLMNAFQSPASQVAVTRLLKASDYSRAGGLQSVASSTVEIAKPVLAAALMSIGGFRTVLLTDLATFLFAFLTLWALVEIPAGSGEAAVPARLTDGIGEGLRYLGRQPGLRTLMLLYAVLNFLGALSFDGLYTALLLARTNGNDWVTGTVSSCMAAGFFAASLLLTVRSLPRRKLPLMYAGSYLCLLGIALFGTGRSTLAWCLFSFAGCFGAPIYSTCQTVLLRETADPHLHGRLFSLLTMASGILTPIGFLLGGFLSDNLLEPWMAARGETQDLLRLLVGSGPGSGMGLLFVLAGTVGIALLTLSLGSRSLARLDEKGETASCVRDADTL